MAEEERIEAAPRPTRRRTRWVVVGAAAVVALGVAGLVLGRPTDPAGRGREAATPAQAIELPRLNGEGTVSLAALHGRPVVVNFFASWCVPCRKELPAFQEVSSRLGDRVAFLGVDHQDDRAGALQLLADTGVRFPTGYDPEGEVARSFGLFGMPTTLFISPDGRVLEKHTGELSRGQLEEKLSDLFGV